MKCVKRLLAIPTLLALCLSSPAAFANEQSCRDLIHIDVSGGQLLKTQYLQPGPAQKDPMAGMTGANLADVELPRTCSSLALMSENVTSPASASFSASVPDSIFAITTMPPLTGFPSVL